MRAWTAASSWVGALGTGGACGASNDTTAHRLLAASVRAGIRGHWGFFLVLQALLFPLSMPVLPFLRIVAGSSVITW